MSSSPDILKRLRADPILNSALEQEAADEIEKLRATLGNLQEALEWIAEDDGGRAGDCARDALGIKQ